MIRDVKIFLWLLKLGALVNIYFLIQTFFSPLSLVDMHIRIPAQILFLVCAYRCLLPVRYTNNIVFHISPFSSIFLTRILATFSEIASIYQLAYLMRLLNVNQVSWVELLSWVMIAQVIISQGFVWGAILTSRLKLYVYEEAGWGIIFIINTVISAYLYITVNDYFDREILIYLNLLFGAVYLPWQYFHLRYLYVDAQKKDQKGKITTSINWIMILQGFYRSITLKNQSTGLKDWGGVIGITWAISYWALIMPVWTYMIVLLV